MQDNISEEIITLDVFKQLSLAQRKAIKNPDLFDLINNIVDDTSSIENDEENSLITNGEDDIKLIKYELSVLKKALNDSSKSCNQTCQDRLISEVKDQITFLRSELASKDEIVKLLINDNSNININKNDNNKSNIIITETNDSFIKAKNPVKQRKNVNQKTNQTTIKNRFEGLQINDTSKNRVQNDNNGNTSRNGPYKQIGLIGDSMFRHVSAKKLKPKLPSNIKPFVKFFTGSTVSCIADHIRPTIRRRAPDKLVIHCAGMKTGSL